MRLIALLNRPSEPTPEPTPSRQHFAVRGPLYGKETVLFVDVAGHHEEECSFWQGGACDCTDAGRQALVRDHHPDCDWLWAGWRCNCDRLERGYKGRAGKLLRRLGVDCAW